MTVEQMEEYLKEVVGVSSTSISGATCIGGYYPEVMERILFYHTGYTKFEQIMEMEGE